MTDVTLAGRTAWLISDGKIGIDVQCKGVADALGLNYEMKHISPRGIWRVIAPWFGPAPSEKIGKPGSRFGPPWPEVVIGTGRQAVAYLRAIRKVAGCESYIIMLQDPKTGAGAADVIWVPEHDSLRAENVITTPTAPHSFTPERLAELRANMPDAIAALPSPRIMLSLGGNSRTHSFSAATIARFAQTIASLAQKDVSFLISPSRRTPEALTEAIVKATASRPRIVWEGAGANPYADFLSHSDFIIVTADSVNITGEACATGKPVYVFEPDGGSAKFTRFHENLRRYGATKPMPARFDHLDSWSYEPLDSALIIAREIEERWRASTRQ